MSLNGLLRRVDWRFLLPEPNPRRSIVFAGAHLAEAIAMVSEEVVTPDEVLPGSCDLAVLTNPDARSLLAAREALSPNGMLYAEYYSPLAGGPPKIREQINNVGFAGSNFYFPWPPPERGSTLFWLPLEAPEALDYFLSNRPPSTTWREGFTRFMMRSVWRLLRRTRLLVPICVTARKSSSSLTSSDGQNGDYLTMISDRWHEWGFGQRPDSLYWLMLTGGLSSTNKVVMVAFSSSESVPRIAVKHARVRESIPFLIREAENLRSLEQLPRGIPPGVPRLLFTERLKDTIAVGETVVNGNPLYTILGKNNYRSIALEATAWLVQLVYKETSIPRSEWWVRAVEPAFGVFERKFGARLGATRMDCIREELLALDWLPTAFEHGDFSPWNVLETDSGRLAVLDWEGGEQYGLPGMDLIYFLTFLAFFHDGAMSSGDFLPTYRASQDPGSFTGSVQVECLEVYFNAIGLDPGLTRPLRLLAWVIHSLTEFPDLDARAGNRRAEEGQPFIDLLVEDLESIDS